MTAKSRVCYTMGPSFIYIFQAHSTDAQLDLDLGNLDAMSELINLCHVPLVVPEQLY